MGCAMTDVGKMAGAMSTCYSPAEHLQNFSHIKLLKKFDSGIAPILVNGTFCPLALAHVLGNIVHCLWPQEQATILA